MRADNYKLASFRIIKLNCDIDPPSVKGEITLSVENTITAFRHADSTIKRGMLKTETSVTSPDCENFKIYLISESIFSFDEMPEDFDNALKESCYPLSKEKIQEAVKSITSAMGINPIELS